MLLSGRDLASYIKERHYQQIRALGFAPKLAIVLSTQANAATQSYVRGTKSRYSGDIGAEVVVLESTGPTDKLVKLIEQLNADPSVNGIIIQTPFAGVELDIALAAVSPTKDVDGLGLRPVFDPATAKGILWLLSSYGIDWKDKTVTVVGQGRLVGQPISNMLDNSQAKVIRCDINTNDLRAATLKADIVITAVGKPNLITAGMVNPGTVVVDAGTAELDGNLVGDVDRALYDDESLKITPNPGGVGPMTVAALFDNLILAAAGRKQ